MSPSLDDLGEHEQQMVRRKRGMLTKSDRMFLWGVQEEELTENARNQRRYQIRRRVRDAIGDFAFLRALPEEDVRLILEDYFTEDPTPEIDWGVWAAIQWFYRAIGEDEFINLVENAIAVNRMEGNPGVKINADVSITIEESEPDGEPKGRNLMEIAVEVLEEFDNNDGVSVDTVMDQMQNRHDLTHEQAEQGIIDALFTGECHLTGDGMLISE